MKRIIAILSFIIMIAIMVPTVFVGCTGEDIDGIKISRKKFTTKKSIEQTNENYTYQDLTFSCSVKNSTKEDLQFTIKFSARYSGLLSKDEVEKQTIILKAGEKKKLSYTRERAGEQIFAKRILIEDVKVVGSE